jgi:hypothetical protein
MWSTLCLSAGARQHVARSCHHCRRKGSWKLQLSLPCGNLMCMYACMQVVGVSRPLHMPPARATRLTAACCCHKAICRQARACLQRGGMHSAATQPEAAHEAAAAAALGMMWTAGWAAHRETIGAHGRAECITPPVAWRLCSGVRWCRSGAIMLVAVCSRGQGTSHAPEQYNCWVFGTAQACL